MKQEELLNLIEELKKAAEVYESKVGTYVPSEWKEKIENKVSSSLGVIQSLLGFHSRNNYLTDAQVKLAEKMIKNARALK